MLKEDFRGGGSPQWGIIVWAVGREGMDLAMGCGAFACADNGSELGRVESSQWVQEIRIGSWLFPGGHTAALELRITPQMFSHGSAGPPGVEEAEVGSPTH